MICPFCDTENRDERDACYHCGKDLSMLRLIVNKAKHHYNLALEHAERGRNSEAAVELQNALDLDARHVNARVVLGTIHAREEKFDQAQEAWQKALELYPPLEKAHTYLNKSETFEKTLPIARFYRVLAFVFAMLFLAAIAGLFWFIRPGAGSFSLRQAVAAYEAGNWGESQEGLQEILKQKNLKPGVRVTAKALNEAIDQAVQVRLDSAEMALRIGDYPNFFEDLAFLRTKSLREEQNRRVEQMRQTAIDHAESEIDQMLTMYRESGIGLPRLRMRMDRIAEAADKGYFKDIDVEGLREEVAQLQQSFEAKELSVIRAEYLESKNIDSALIRTFSIVQAGGPAAGEEAKSFYANLLRQVVQRYRDEVKPLVEARDFDAAKSRAKQRLEVYPEALRKEILSRVTPVDGMIRQAQAKDYLAELEDFASTGSYEEFIVLARKKKDYELSKTAVKDIETSVTLYREELIEEEMVALRTLVAKKQWDEAAQTIEMLREQAPDGEQKDELDKIAAQVDKGRLNQFIDQLVAIDSRFDHPPARRVPRETAERIVAEFEQLNAAIPENMKYRRRQLNFYHAVSQFVLGSDEEATKTLEKFIETYKGDYIETAKEYLDLLEKRQQTKAQDQKEDSEEAATQASQPTAG